MFKKKKQNNNNKTFVFNYACKDAEKNVAFSATNNEASANWCDENGKYQSYEKLPINDSFWQELEGITQSFGVFEWKAYKLYSHFAFSLDTSVFNAEGTFPDGASFAANNFHGEPNGFEEALKAYKALFAALKE